MEQNTGMPACASCKHQRKKCTEKCVLAPFFPANKSREFQAVHKLFGVSNVTKIVKSLNEEEDRKRAVDTLIWEAFCREKDRVLGCYGEYKKVYEELKLYKTQYGQLQLQEQGSMLYKTQPAPNLVGWNSINGICNKGMSVVGGGANQHNGLLNYSQNNDDSCIADSTQFSYSSDHLMQGVERKRQERDLGSVIFLPQQHPIHSLNHQYYISG